MNKYLMITGIFLFALGTAFQLYPMETLAPFVVTPESATISQGQTQTFSAAINEQVDMQNVNVEWKLNGVTVKSGNGLDIDILVYTTSSSLPIGSYVVSATASGYMGGFYEVDSSTLTVENANPTPKPSATPVPTPPPTPQPNPDPSQVNVQVIAGDGGFTNPASGVYEYAKGAPVTVYAYANDGYLFDYWLKSNGQKTFASTFTGNADSEFSVQAVFKPESQDSGDLKLLTSSMQVAGIALFGVGWFIKKKGKKS